MNYSIKNLREVEDSAVKHGFSEMQEAHFAREDVDAEDTGFTYLVFKPGKRQAFGHRHEEAEEVYVVISGSGRLRLDDEVVGVERLDAIRVAPSVTRAFEAGPEGLEVLAFGPHHAGDGEVLPDFWKD
jgi:mannose-6-phosphate isomerase-like protein (cupin superfamily)